MSAAPRRAGRRAPTPPTPLPTELVRARPLALLSRRFSVPVTTVVAGAGFGKSTLLAQAIRSNQADPCGIDAWVSCEPGDGDERQLAAAIVAALGVVSTRREPVEMVLDAVARLAPVDICVVVDDVHEVPDASSGATLLASMTDRLPPHSHLVLAGRRPPPVRLARRRAAGQVVDIGADDLVFTDAEVSALSNLVGHDVVAAPERFGGWPSLVRLALSTSEASPPQFLWEEIVAGLDERQQRALIALATLGWGTVADVEHVAGLDRLDLERLARDVPLVHADADGWFRVHDLWEDAIERIFPDDTCREPRRRALRLFRSRGETLRAGWRAVRWGDDEALALAARSLVRDTFGALPIDTAERWIAECPAGARTAPDLRLLELALAHALRHDHEHLGEQVEVVADQYAAMGDLEGEAVALALGAVVAHMFGDLARLIAIDERARTVGATSSEPILALLAGSIAAAVASLRGDVDAALAAVEELSSASAPASMIEVVDRLHISMLNLAGRADEAVVVAAALADSPSAYVRMIPDHARWLAGDPSGFPADALPEDPGPGTNERYHFYHATHMTMIAASLGDSGMTERLRPVIEKSAAAALDSRDRAMAAIATAARHVVMHDEAAAATTIATHVDEHPADDLLADIHLRRVLPIAYVCDPRIRDRWNARPLGPSHIRQRVVADLLLSARAGELTSTTEIPSTPVVLTALPLPWSIELAARAAAVGNAGGRRLAVELAASSPSAVHREFAGAALCGDDQVRHGASSLLDLLPDPAHRPLLLSVLGDLTVEVAGEEVVNDDARRRRVRTMIELLVLGGPYRREQLADLMWPDLHPEAASRNLRVTLTRVRRVLDATGGARPVLQTDAGRVGLAGPPGVDVDLWRFRADVADADAAERRGDPTAAMAALERACHRWRGEPFADLDEVAEVAGAVEEVRRLVVDTAQRLGDLLLVVGRFDEAAAWAERVRRASPYDERAHRLLIAAHLQRGDRRAVAGAVTATRAMLSELGVEPEPATRMLLRRGAP